MVTLRILDFVRCDAVDVIAEMDRILRQDTMEMINMLTPILRSLHWSVALFEGQFLVGKKGFWRPTAG